MFTSVRLFSVCAACAHLGNDALRIATKRRAGGNQDYAGWNKKYASTSSEEDSDDNIEEDSDDEEDSMYDSENSLPSNDGNDDNKDDDKEFFDCQEQASSLFHCIGCQDQDQQGGSGGQRLLYSPTSLDDFNLAEQDRKRNKTGAASSGRMSSAPTAQKSAEELLLEADKAAKRNLKAAETAYLEAIKLYHDEQLLFLLAKERLKQENWLGAVDAALDFYAQTHLEFYEQRPDLQRQTREKTQKLLADAYARLPANTLSVYSRWMPNKLSALSRADLLFITAAARFGTACVIDPNYPGGFVSLPQIIAAARFDRATSDNATLNHYVHALKAAYKLREVEDNERRTTVLLRSIERHIIPDDYANQNHSAEKYEEELSRFVDAVVAT